MEAGDGIKLSEVNCNPIHTIRLLYHDDRRTVLGKGNLSNDLLPESFYFLFKEVFKLIFACTLPCLSKCDVMFKGTCATWYI